MRVHAQTDAHMDARMPAQTHSRGAHALATIARASEWPKSKKFLIPSEELVRDQRKARAHAFWNLKADEVT